MLVLGQSIIVGVVGELDLCKLDDTAFRPHDLACSFQSAQGCFRRGPLRFVGPPR